MKDRIDKYVDQNYESFREYVREDVYGRISSSKTILTIIVILINSTVLNSTLFCNRDSCLYSLSFTPSILICAACFPKLKLIRKLKLNPLYVLKAFIISVIFGFKSTLNIWDYGPVMDDNNVPIMTCVSLLIASIWFWPTTTKKQSYVVSLSITILYLVLFRNSFQLNLEGLIVGTTIGGSIGALTSLLILQFRKSNFYSQNLNRMILDGITDKTSIDLTHFNIPEKESKLYMAVVFFDIVGYSRSRLDNDDLFQYVKDINASITSSVDKFGGVIDKSLGDGMLAIFPSVEASIRSCIEVQRNSLENPDPDKKPFNLRIGINYCEVTKGNLGTSKRIDMTIIGDGVNDAKRLESACNPKKILVSSSVMEALPIQATEDVSIYPTLMQKKHHSNDFEAYEIDPFNNDKDILIDAENAYWNEHDLYIEDTRYKLDHSMKVIADKWELEVIDVSKFGLGVKSPQCLAPGFQLECEVIGNIGEKLAKENLHLFTATVVWSREDRHSNSYRLGLKIKEHKRLREEFMDVLTLHGIINSHVQAG